MAAGTIDASPELAARRARQALARAVLPECAVSPRLGDIVLLPHQRALAALVGARLRRWGGVLVSEPPGWGKTFTALAAVDAREGAIVAPAALRARWGDALARGGRRAAFVSVESLSRRRAELDPSWVVVDESHHLRNPSTRRYDAAAALCLGASVILLTATPIQNRRDDLAAQLALFLGEGAFELPMAALASHVLRSAADSAPALPAVAAPVWLRIGGDDAWLDRIARLPPAVPPRDGGAADALERYTLVRQWASSRAALVGGLRRRLGASLALEESLAAGAAPTRRDLAAWEVDGDVLQPAFPGLMVATPPAEPATPPASRLRRVRRHVRAVRTLLAGLARAEDPDAERAAVLRSTLDRHAGERVVAFSAFAETVAALAHRLRNVPGVAWVTASGAHIASGALPRDELLRQFAATPVRVAAAERVRLLVTTDVLSEGLDLQGASVVVHLDLPWNPARLEQRVGRLRRIGAPGDRVTVYAFAPPADAERLLRIEQRLRAKLAGAAALGRGATPILPLVGGVDGTAPPGEADLEAAIVARLAEWAPPLTGGDESPGMASAGSALARVDRDDRSPEIARPASGARALPGRIVAAVVAVRAGWIATVDGGDRSIVADLGDGPTESRATVAEALELAGSEATVPEAVEVERASMQLAAWTRRRDGRRLVGGVGELPMGESRRRAARRLAALAGRLDLSGRFRLAGPVRAARDALARRAGIGLDRELAAADAEPDDARWLAAVAARGARGVRGVRGEPPGDGDDGRGTAPGEVLILLVARPR